MTRQLDTLISHHFAPISGLKLHYVEAGSGPLVILLHGFPESWYSWRHQIIALASAGYRVVAPTQRGYGLTGGPEDKECYSIFDLVGDVVALVKHLGQDRPTVVGHDWGAPVAWGCAQFRPDLFAGVVGLSVPPRPRTSRPPLEILQERIGPSFYQIYFQEEGPPEEDLGRDVRSTITRFLYAASGDYPTLWTPIRPGTKGLFDEVELPKHLMEWITDEDIDFYTSEFKESGFRRPLNWYRNIDRNWRLTSPWHRSPILIPSLFISGTQDIIASWLASGDLYAQMSSYMPKLIAVEIIDGCGHWTQQEEPQRVNELLIDFLEGIGVDK